MPMRHISFIGNELTGQTIHHRKRHILRWFPVTLSLVNKPIVNLLLVQPSCFSQCNLITFLDNKRQRKFWFLKLRLKFSNCCFKQRFHVVHSRKWKMNENDQVFSLASYFIVFNNFLINWRIKKKKVFVLRKRVLDGPDLYRVTVPTNLTWHIKKKLTFQKKNNNNIWIHIIQLLIQPADNKQKLASTFY